jgi:hypothetical protein
VLQFMGWVFQIKEASDNYIFTVFFFNKIIGILLLPLVIYLLISSRFANQISMVALFLLCVILIYRYALSYISLAKTIQLNKFHFFLYLCTLEIVPLLIIYKMLLNNSKFLV